MTASKSGRRPRKRWLLAGATAVGVVAVVLAVAANASKGSGKAPVPTPPATQLSDSQPKLVFTYFYYWYDLPNGTHSTALTNRPAAPDASYKSVPWLKQQLSDMEYAGIDVALAVYWGDEEPSSDVGLRNMAQAASALRAEGSTPPTIGMFLDTGQIGRWPEGQRDLTKEGNQARVYALIKRFYSEVPRDQWAEVEGRPVVWLWGSWLGIRFDQAFFDYVYARFTADFGVRPYVVADNSWRYATKDKLFGGTEQDMSRPIAVDDFYSWGASLTGYREEGGNIAEIGPGYDERQLKGSDRTGRFTDRQDGLFYQQSWRAAIASGKRFVAIETWDEFHEASEIADSVEYGRRYLDLTRQFAAQFKGGQ